MNWEEVILTRSAWDLAVNAVPLLSKVVLDAFESIKGGHFLGPLVCSRLTSCVMGWVLVLYLLSGRLLRYRSRFIVPESWLTLGTVAGCTCGGLQTSILLASFVAVGLTRWALRLVCCAVCIWLRVLWLSLHSFFNYATCTLEDLLFIELYLKF